MNGTAPFYNRVIEKISTVFGALFSDIYVVRPKADGTTDRTILVPITYAPKNHRQIRAKQNEDLGREINQVLPAMAFQLMNIEADEQRQGPTTNRWLAPNSANTSQLMNIPAPLAYDFDYELYIKINRVADGFQILEQSMTQFRQQLTASINFIDGVELPLDLTIFIDNVSMEDSYEGPLVEKREIIYTLTFKVKGWLFGPIGTAGLIKKIQIDFHPTMADPGTRISRIAIQPGLTANNTPTTNSALSINYNLINATDPFGICTDITDYSDGKHYNPLTDTDIA
jgi:hypothetical protein